MHKSLPLTLVFALALIAFFAAPVLAADEKYDEAALKKCVEGGTNFLISKGLQEDGSYSLTPATSPAVTALCVAGILRHGRSPDDPQIAKSLKYLEGFVQPDGGIYKKDSTIQNYETSIGILAFAAANKDGRYNDLIKKAEQFVKSIQWGADGSIDQSAINYGGAGYGRSKTRPDLSNTGFLLEALQAAGADGEDEAVRRALIFVSRCQNLESEYNTSAFAAKVNDGGFYYTISDGGASMAGKTDDGTGLRSYGSMTYTGLKSMIFAGLKADDKRVKAAVDWIKKNYDLGSNPGMGQAGLYYGYHTFAKALKALGDDTITDAKGVTHNWRAELVNEIAKRQQPDGSWSNPEKRFSEGDPNLVTAYVLLTLSHVKPDGK